ncbi:hypothetical protein COO60DRAFT_1645356 [Scenedesmus sp. NREL 46B-D3]|nr:hypothetical protein COO60DRAFT_1645356 [Scenedesmus sp. NREL 46B-D3]
MDQQEYEQQQLNDEQQGAAAAAAAPAAGAAAAHVTTEAQQGGMLHMDMQPDEDDFMMEVGTLRCCCPALRSAELALSPRVSSHAAAESVKMLFIFQNLRQLQLRLDFDSIQVGQRLVCAIAELMQLTSLHLLHGSLQPGLALAHWSSLGQLAELKLLPAEQAGLGDAQLEQLPLLSTTLTSLALRCHPSRASHAGRRHLSTLTSLRQLSCCPVGRGLSSGELQGLVGMPRLARLTLGLTDASEVLLFGQLQLQQASPRLCLLLRDGQFRVPPADVLSVAGWCLARHLVKLSIGPLAAACPGDVLLMLATLRQLQELRLRLVAPLDQHFSGTVDLLALSPLQRLTCLELLASSRLYVPFDVKVVSLASLAWPALAALRLSLAGKPELMAESLALCDNFSCLTELQLFSPVDDLAAAAAAAESAAAAASAPLIRSSSSSGAAAVSAEQHSTGVEAQGSGSWVDWAVSGFSSFHLSRVSTGPLQASNSGSVDGSGSSAAHAPLRSRTLPARTSIGSPLARDVMQQHLGVAAGTAGHSLDAALLDKPHSAAAAARSAAAAAAAAAAAGQQLSVSSEAAAAAAAAGAAPGCDMAMYRASARMLPIVLSYLPQSLSKLCLESFHLVATGLPVAASPGWHQQRHSTFSDIRQPSLQQQLGTSSSRLGRQQPDHQQQAHAEQQQHHAQLQQQRWQTVQEVHQQDEVAAAPSSNTDSSHAEPLATSMLQPPAAPTLAATASEDAGAGHGQQPTAAATPAGVLISSGSSSSHGPHASSSAGVSTRPAKLPLQQLRHLELEECCVDDAAMAAILMAATGLRTLQLTGMEGLTDAGLAELTRLRHLTRLVIEAEQTPGITLRAFGGLSHLASLKKLRWCSRDGMHGPVDAGVLCEQLCALTGLRQLVLLTGQQELLSSMSGWQVVLQRQLPLCRLVLWRELLEEVPWGDVPDEDS